MFKYMSKAASIFDILKHKKITRDFISARVREKKTIYLYLPTYRYTYKNIVYVVLVSTWYFIRVHQKISTIPFSRSDHFHPLYVILLIIVVDC